MRWPSDWHGISSIMRQIEYGGKIYPSIRALARATGVHHKQIHSRLATGKSLDASVDPTPLRRRSLVVNGVEYRSIEAAARELGIWAGSVIYRMNKGWTADQAFGFSVPPRTDKCSGVVYLITNSVNRKKYVGITVTGLQTRINGHVNAAARGKAGKLYDAIRAIGAHRFQIVVLENVNSRTRLAELEKQYIEQYDCVRRGYNMTAGGGWCGHGETKIVVDGKMFSDVHEVATHVGVHVATIRRRIRLGLPVLMEAQS